MFTLYQKSNIFFYLKFSFTKIHESRNNRGRGDHFNLNSTTFTHFIGRELTSAHSNALLHPISKCHQFRLVLLNNLFIYLFIYVFIFFFKEVNKGCSKEIIFRTSLINSAYKWGSHPWRLYLSERSSTKLVRCHNSWIIKAWR